MDIKVHINSTRTIHVPITFLKNLTAGAGTSYIGLG
jgi:hypothetical protein